MKKYLGLVAALAFGALIATNIGPATAAFWQWSKTSSSNSNADPSINWAEGVSPSSVNDSARAMMARTAEYRDDVSGGLTATGTSSAYALATNQGNIPSPPSNGQMLAFIPNVTNGTAPTLSVDGGTAYPLQSSAGIAIGGGTIVAGTPYRISFNATATAWVLEAGYGNPYSIALGAFMQSSLPTPPNSNFILPAGQCISTSTYAAYWAALGSPASGACPGGQFAVIDVRGRNLVALDNLNGTPANRLTASSSGCGTAMTSIGATCANGNESQTLTAAQLPANIPNSANSIFSPNAGLGTYTIGNNGGIQVVQGAGVIVPYGASNVTFGASISTTVTINAAGGGSHPLMNPNIGVSVFLRVL